MADSIRILIVEDNPVDAELVVREIGREGMEFSHETVTGRNAFETALAAVTLPDIVLSDYNLPDLRGFDVIEAVHQRDPVLPVVIVTGSISEEVAVDCIKAGAADYVIKGNLTRLPVAVRGAIENARLRARGRELESRLLQVHKLDAIGRLAGGVAHDFNNLLGVITGYADLLESTLDHGHPAMRRLEQIRRATNSAAALTRQLLALGRRQVLQPVPVDLNGLVTEITGMIRRLVPETITIETSLCADTPLVVVDRSQIEQVILNLALNARDAMPGSSSREVPNAVPEWGADVLVRIRAASPRHEPSVARGRAIPIKPSAPGLQARAPPGLSARGYPR